MILPKKRTKRDILIHIQNMKQNTISKTLLNLLSSGKNHTHERIKHICVVKSFFFPEQCPTSSSKDISQANFTRDAVASTLLI